MAVIATPVRSRESYADGRSFERFGAFEVIDFEVAYAVDPSNLANSRIVDLEKAQRRSDGSVRFQGNARLILPRATRPSCLLVDVPNRGRPVAFSFNRPSSTELQHTTTPCGDGFLCRHGFAVLSIGWQFDADGMRLEVPDALDGLQPISGDAICEMQPNRNTNSLLVGQGGKCTYKPTDGAVLYQRSNTQQPFELVSPNQWRFGRTRAGQFDPSPRFISKDGGFEKGVIYTLVYQTSGAPIVGLGLLALRDAAAWFRYDFNWPSTRPEFAIAYGASQTGRLLRQFVYEGLNEDERGRQVFDAVMPHIAGGQRGDFNHRFAQPGSIGIPSAGQCFPFSTAVSFDARSGRSDGLLTRCPQPPKVVSTNTSWEYWRGDAALAHVSIDGKNDLELSGEERLYLFAGTHHINGVLPHTNQLALTGDLVTYPLNTISFTPLLRAALVNTLDWVRDGKEPPASRYPRLDDNSLVDRKEVLEKFAKKTYFRVLPNADSLSGLWSMDLGPELEHGICKHPARLIEPYPRLVPDVDSTLNEVAGIRLPEIKIPIGIHTGWNPRHEHHGAEDQIATFVGFSEFGESTSIPSSRASCIAQVSACVDELVAKRFVLPEDHRLVSKNALERYDIAVTATHPK